MVLTRSELITALRRVGLLGSVEAGIFDNVLSPSEGATDYTAEIEALQAKDVSQDALIATNNSALDQRVTDIENLPAGVDYSAQITSLQDKDVTHDTRITANEASLLSKAGLVNGKVPYDQLPEFPVGRKVNVVNEAARLALPVYGDLTIAYESDTGDAWGLDANDDPSVAGNWSKLGNTQAIGVASFNGRTGNIGPQTGDYNTGQITELVDKQFVTDVQKAEWSGKETTSGAQTKATAAQTAAKTYADTTFVPLSQKAASDGVAPLDSGSRVPLVNLPTFMPQRQRIWRDVKSARTHLGWWLNSSGNEMVVRVRTAPSTLTTRYIRAQIQKADGTGTLAFSSESYNNAATRWLVMELIVPHGYQYMFFTDGGTTVAGFEAWGELS
jgi:hypothetical protein